MFMLHKFWIAWLMEVMTCTHCWIFAQTFNEWLGVCVFFYYYCFGSVLSRIIQLQWFQIQISIVEVTINWQLSLGTLLSALISVIIFSNAGIVIFSYTPAKDQFILISYSAVNLKTLAECAVLVAFCLQDHMLSRNYCHHRKYMEYTEVYIVGWVLILVLCKTGTRVKAMRQLLKYLVDGDIFIALFTKLIWLFCLNSLQSCLVFQGL